ncbi:arylsulfatase [Chryseolinea lacunae]|uniref:Sulfatase-like hydrolase/transferase n=1 Tax=Chryseolinea lacunae TaxID=2801331 RepID=A0ABS1KU33_9BACT|nr:arylsulfatase [Chryseolinea lacunae]MBL0742708.1 sulfatase-like hydrolase/transferase [Chryseolinea lacunae]
MKILQTPVEKTLRVLSVAFLSAAVYLPSAHGQQTDQTWKGKVSKSAKDSQPYKVDYVTKAKPGSPNIVWIILDDVGFGATSAFGGLIRTPNLDSLANQGLRYTNFHTAGICSPTRSALLTGRNHHSVGMGLFPHFYLSADYPGYNGHILPEKGTIAETLRESGYSTYQLGKWHLTPDDEATDLGPFVRWPSGKGFDHNYGFLGGATDQYKPDLVEDNQHIKPDGRHLNELLADKAISYVSRQKAVNPDKPFFLYYATGAGHAPHQVDKVWSDKYKGQFDEGWDVYREKVIANQKKLGVIPANAQLPARDSYLKAWKDLPAEEKRLYARFMEVYAGFLEETDHEIGRFLKHLKTSGQLENTAVFVMIGDNGGSKEGLEYGVTTKSIRFGADAVTREDYRKFMLSEYDKIGGKDVASVANYPLGWAQATNTPFRFWKSDANAEGATHNPLIVYYPKGIKEKGGIRNQYTHLIDLYPTALELTGTKQPETIRGYKQDPLHGTSLAFSLNDKDAASRHTQQYYCIFGNRAIYKDGWKAAAAHHPNSLELFTYAGEPKPAIENNPDTEVWELYNLNEDFNELKDLAKKHPEKLKELKDLFDAEAAKYNIYPLIDIEHAATRYKLQPPPTPKPATTPSSK